ncbi:Alpha-L-fucosidase 2 [Apostasia shenzhenica]|uniref:Alpha-L-fucosidase 2 n=1 Tax=Apostasia shenzhenica TaxID=1088818 RepID=A0A2I0ARH9_9ASPA|nr:Alpha-L-fucosidase 2 [Apostasia shenzhenica]
MDGEGEWVWVRPPTEADREWWGDGVGGLYADEEPARLLKVVFTEPAKYWTDAAPIGNGRLGAMVWGGVPNETLQLNHDTLWTGVPGDYTNPEAPRVLSKVRKLVDDGHYAVATEVAFGLSGNPSDVYQPLGSINLEFDDSHASFTSYERELDLSTATVKVKYSSNDVQFTREHFSSNPHQVIVNKISSNKSGSLSFTVYLDSELHHHSSVNDVNQIVMEGSCPGKRSSTSENPKGIEFTAVLDLQIAGENSVVQVIEDRKLKVDGADWALFLVAASSSFEGPFTNPSDSKRNPTSESLNTLKSLKSMTFSQLRTYHVNDYEKLFHRVSLQLSNGSNGANESNHKHIRSSLVCNANPKSLKQNSSFNGSQVSTAERVRSFKNDEDPSLVELLFQYGRYLLISCSRPGTQVSNLQGIWNKDVQPPWDAAPHLNINLQMNYWPCLPCNLRECQDPLFDYITSMAINGAKTAKVNYEASGWVAHQISDIWVKTSPDQGDPVWAIFPMGGAWLCTHLWEHYTYTLDKEFLEKTTYPLLEGCAAFLLDWLIEGRGGYLETNPSTSPEHHFISPDGNLASVSYSSTIDIAIIREIFNSIISSAEVLGRSNDGLIKRVKTALPKLPPTRIARDGSILEWAQDFEDPEVHHRHVSHLFGLFPGHTITVEKTPELCKAATNSLYKRGDAGPGWSTAWKMALWARLRDSEHAYNLIKQLINLVDPNHEADFEGGLYSNLFTAHPPFQIDANFGFSAAIAEMLVQSTLHDLYLLPALPRDKWLEGCVRGLKARGGVTVNICWKEGKLHEASVWANNHTSLAKRLHYHGKVADIRLSCRKIYVFNKHLKCLKIKSIPNGALES